MKIKKISHCRNSSQIQ